MNKRSAIILAVVVGVLSSLLTLIVISVVSGLDLFNMGAAEGELPVSEFSKVENIIEENYLRDFNMEDLQYAGLKAMVAALDDPYSVYYTPDEYSAFKQEASGEYYGLGMVISKDDATGLAKVEYFFEGSSAEEAGVKVGDFIISVDGQDVTDMTLQELGTLCIGEDGTTLKMGVLRGDEAFEYDIVRRAVTRDMVKYKMLDDGIGYMQIIQFGGNCEELFNEALAFFKEQQAKGIVVDLRDDPGGYLTTVVNVLNKLLPEGTLVYTEDRKGRRETWSSDPEHIDIPLSVIVNGNTASAAEIFAGAVQDYEYGDIVGTTTYGKGVVQVVIPIPSTGGGMKITTSQYFTPNGRTIDKNGIYPDVYVDLQQEFKDDPSSYSFEQDAQVNKAIEVLKQRIGG
jgi:carboxyl-terminal processing protease